MKGGYLAVGALAAATTAVVYFNRGKLYDRRLGLLVGNYACRSLPDSVLPKYSPHTPVQGLDCPLESTLMVLVEEGTGNIIMSLGQRPGKDPEWTLVGGKNESWKGDEDAMTDYSDKRFIVNGRQFTADECKDVVFENPRGSLAREVVEELVGTKDPLTKEQLVQFDWLIAKIHQSPDWRFVKTSKSVKLSDGSKIEGFNTYMGLCCVSLSVHEIVLLNAQIQKYDNREHREFSVKEWAVKEIEPKPGKRNNKFVVDVGEEYPIRKYNDNIMFVFYWKEFSELISKGKH